MWWMKRFLLVEDIVFMMTEKNPSTFFSAYSSWFLLGRNLFECNNYTHARRKTELNKFRFHRSICKESTSIEKKKINVERKVFHISWIQHKHRLWFWNTCIWRSRSVQTLSRWIVRNLKHLSNFVWTFTTNHISYGFTTNGK